MRFALSVSALVFCGLVGVALAGASPEVQAPRSAGCHGQQLVAAPAASCHGINLKVPAAVASDDCGCHGRSGSRVTGAERREIRSMARYNFRETKAAGRAAAHQGNGVGSVSMSAPSMELVPAASACPSCDCSPCNCK